MHLKAVKCMFAAMWEQKSPLLRKMKSHQHSEMSYSLKSNSKRQTPVSRREALPTSLHGGHGEELRLLLYLC